ncbi:MAG: DUF2268 domain-containing putative Zn-dependent protease [Pseudomonadota bacterium]
MTIRTHVFDAGGHFGRALPTIRRTLAAAVDHVSQVSALDNVDMVVQPVDFGTDQYPIAAFTSGPHNIHIGIERSQLRSEDLEDELYRSTIHELHHALRWRHLTKPWTVGEMVTLEGLALLADHAAAGPQDEVDRPLSDPDRALADLAAIRCDPLSRHRAWLYSSEDAQPGGVGRVYALGALLMSAALARLSLDPWTAADRPARDLLDHGYAALADDQTQRKRPA